ncbi:MAG: zinc ribbon domain-containing protein [Candidatus Ancaeobacter aquaticus]|nr:zinc ribbon domain-containing protein [Candidatus Ancaeobacter aquaticus]
MPIYTYICRECKEKFDLLVGVTAEKTELKCKKCGSKNIEKIPGAFSVGSSGGGSGSSGPSCPDGTCNL